MTNRYRPHVLVLPEDDANSRVANGFLLDLDQSAIMKIQVLPEVGGWRAVLDISSQITSLEWIAIANDIWFY